MTKVILLGDSTIDNVYWVNQGKTVTQHLSSLLPNYEVINFAVDGFTTASVLYGEFKDFEVVSPNHPHEYFKPIDALKKQTDVTHIVLSVLGNDFRAELSQIISSPFSQRLQIIDEIIERIVTNYSKIIEEIREAQPEAKLHLAIQYVPYVEKDSYLIYFLMHKLQNNYELGLGPFDTYLQLMYYSLVGLNEQEQRKAVVLLQQLITKVYQKIFDKLQDESLAILDLASSFNCRDSALYESQIEPSAIGGELIARLIANSVDNHDFSKDSRLYAFPSPSVGMVNYSLSDIKELWYPGRIPINKKEALLFFKDRYLKQLENNHQLCLRQPSLFSTDPVDLTTQTLEELVHQAQSNKKGQILKIMQDLGWLNETGEIDAYFVKILS